MAILSRLKYLIGFLVLFVALTFISIAISEMLHDMRIDLPGTFVRVSMVYVPVCAGQHRRFWS